MPRRSRSSPPSPRQTTFLVPGIHCPTCASFIEDFLFCLRPKHIAVETSIVSHSVTVKHDASLSARIISKALGEAGYKVDTIISDLQSREGSPSNASGGADDDFPLAWLNQALERWNRRKKAADEETTRRRHMEHCEQCRTEQLEAVSGDDGRQPSSSGSSDVQELGSPFVVIESSSASVKVFQASVSITGMSCSSCVGKITAALEQESWVRSVNVGLLTQSASVEFEGEQHAAELVKVIGDLGYEASLEHVDELRPESGAGSRAAEDLWKGSYSIGGMTCSSCVGTITNALESLPWTKSVDVNLITNSAVVVFEDKSHLNEIVDAIEDVGYTAKLNDVANLGKEKVQDGHRTVSIRINGMYCQHCPGRVIEAMNSFGGRVTIEQSATMKNPVMTISYTPSSPEFTIRTILSAVSAADPALDPTIYHPPTVEERAAQMHARIRQRMFIRVLLSFIIAVPAFIIGVVFMTLVPPTISGRRYLMEQLRGVTRAEWALFIMATPVYFFAADVFHRRTIKELRSLWKRGSPVPILRRFYRFGSMDMLMSFGTTIAYFASIIELILAAIRPDPTNMRNKTYFDSVVFLTMFLLIGRLIEAYSKAKTGEAVAMLGKLRPKEALLVVPDDGQAGVDRTESLPIDMLDFGDMVRVVHGASPPWDGILLQGYGDFDESSLTGESRLVKKTIGDSVYSGTVNKGGPILMRTTGASGDSMLDQIIKVVREGQARRAPIERVADMLTSYFVPVVTLIAISTWLIWLSLGLSKSLPEEYLDVKVGGWPFWSLQFAIAVFIIACPCGIGLAAPTALFVGGGLAAKHGILVKGGGEAFQEASRLDVIVFDKTGTLTQGGEPKITDHQFLISSDDGWDEKMILDVLGELERNSSHPIGKAIVAFCESRDAKGAKAKDVEEIAGKGMKGSFDVETLSHPVEVLMGNEALMADNRISFDSTASAILESWKGQAKSVVLAAAKSTSPTADLVWTPLAIFAVSDPLRPESRPVVEALHRQGLDVWMISGDNPTTAQAVGAMVGIPPEHILAGVLPEQKADKIKYLQKSQVKSSPESFFRFGRQRLKQRGIVAMVGDGVNDSPALTVADVGIAIGSGSDVAISAAEFVLIRSSLTTLLILITLSRTVFRRVKFNFAWALVYNLMALPIAAGVLYPVRTNGQHIRLDPVWASLAMALSSLSVICSSLLLRSRLPLVGFRDDGTKSG